MFGLNLMLDPDLLETLLEGQNDFVSEESGTTKVLTPWREINLVSVSLAAGSGRFDLSCVIGFSPMLSVWSRLGFLTIVYRLCF